MAAPVALYSYLGIEPTEDLEVNVVDVGANMLATKPPYQSMVDHKHARVIGFEPNQEALATLQAQATPQEVYLPQAVGADGEAELKLCRMSGMTSLLEPNFELLNLLHYHGVWAEVQER